MTPAEFTAARKALAMSQAEMAKAMGVTRETICRIERGETIPKVYQLAIDAIWWKWCEILTIPTRKKYRFDFQKCNVQPENTDWQSPLDISNAGAYVPETADTAAQGWTVSGVACELLRLRRAQYEAEMMDLRATKTDSETN